MLFFSHEIKYSCLNAKTLVDKLNITVIAKKKLMLFSILLRI